MIIFQRSCWFQQGNNIDIVQEVMLHFLNLILKYSNLVWVEGGWTCVCIISVLVQGRETLPLAYLSSVVFCQTFDNQNAEGSGRSAEPYR